MSHVIYVNPLYPEIVVYIECSFVRRPYVITPTQVAQSRSSLGIREIKLVNKGQPKIEWVWAIPQKLSKGLTFFLNKWKRQSPSKQLKREKTALE